MSEWAQLIDARRQALEEAAAIADEWEAHAKARVTDDEEDHDHSTYMTGRMLCALELSRSIRALIHQTEKEG